ncbi:30S ribosomal protein S16 [Nesterenkonia sp. NBAIMH1]|uniref:30S ribosomal protein S16 n=1 Tax=Nesterenkonia sp. NBAIMH1 TaxID=2600320 RepID=UPI0011B71132|nr:30S ribosomal protein S16 [Nesterenkonia sp. NBAIMH1]
MAVKIRLKRMGKVRAPHYRVVVADSRTKRDGAAIEQIGKYHPTQEPSLIDIDTERAQYWLSVGAQPTEQVMALLKVTGDWQKFKGLEGSEGTLRTKEAPQEYTVPEKGSVIVENTGSTENPTDEKAPAEAPEASAEETPAPDAAEEVAAEKAAE